MKKDDRRARHVSARAIDILFYRPRRATDKEVTTDSRWDINISPTPGIAVLLHAYSGDYLSMSFVEPAHRISQMSTQGSEIVVIDTVGFGAFYRCVA